MVSIRSFGSTLWSISPKAKRCGVSTRRKACVMLELTERIVPVYWTRDCRGLDSIKPASDEMTIDFYALKIVYLVQDSEN